MDRVAIISDVHGNITALRTVINDIHMRGISKIFCLGDSVLKGVSPDLVIDLLHSSCDVILKGNCDEACVNSRIRTWTKDKIGPNRVDFLKNLPIFFEFYMSGYFIRLFHASPYSLEHVFNPMFRNHSTKYSDIELENPEMLFENTSFINKATSDAVPDIIGYGHLHTPFIVRFKNKALFNPGSVGAPIEMLNTINEISTSRFSTVSSYIILEGFYGKKELSSFSFNLVRIPYNIDEEIELIKKSDVSNKGEIISALKTAIS